MIGRALIASVLLAAAVAPATGQNRQPAPPGSKTLELIDASGQRRTMTVADLAKLPHIEADVSSHNVNGKYRGVPLGDLLRLVGSPASDSIRGAALAQYVVVEATDAYRVVFAIAELDTGFTDKSVFVADAKNGAPLDSSEGPFRLIVVGEKRPARWVRGVAKIRIARLGPSPQ
jgi:hypothetical protein